MINWSDLLKQILDWLEKVMPSVMGAFAVGYSWGAKKLKLAKIQNLDLQLKNDELQNKLDVEKQFSGMSDSDVIDSVAGPGDPPSKPTSKSGQGS